MTTLAPRPPVLSLHARISENTPRDLHGVHILTRLAEHTFAVKPQVIVGRAGPYGRTPWRADLEASRLVLQEAGRSLATVLRTAVSPPLTLASDCALALATLPAVFSVYPNARILWLDAHCDFDTPETTTLGFLGCMSLAGACGEWKTGFAPLVPTQQVVLCGTRPAAGDFDSVAQQRVARSGVMLIDLSEALVGETLAALEGAPVYVHLDPDVLDPSVNPVPYARPSGLSAPALRGLLSAVAAHHPIIGVEISAFHAPDAVPAHDALAELLIASVTPLLAAPSPAVMEGQATPSWRG